MPTATAARYLRTDPLRTPASGVDRAAKRINGVAIMTVGEVRGHDFEADATTIDEVVEHGNAASKGLKARFTHPNLSNDGMGSFLGRFRDFRRDGDIARADLQLSATAFDTPNGDLATYVMDLAEESPDMFGSSVVVKPRAVFRIDADGARATDADGAPLPPLLRVEKLHAADLVDEPAANAALFGDDKMPDFGARQGTAILDRLFGGLDPEEIRTRVDAFVDRYLRTKGPAPMADQPTVPTPWPAPAPAPALELATAPQPTAAPPAVELATAPDLPVERFAPPMAPVEQLHTLGPVSMNGTPVVDPASAERIRCAAILALCERHNCPHAAAWLAEGISQADAQTRVLAFLANSQQPIGDGGPAGERPTGKPADPDAEYKTEYAEQQDALVALGIGEESYVRSRRVSAGAEPLIPIPTL